MVSLLCLCACGDVGSSSIESSQNQTNSQSQNEPELTCSVACEVNSENQVVKGTKECEGSAPFLVTVVNQSQCDSFEEFTADAEDSVG